MKFFVFSILSLLSCTAHAEEWIVKFDVDVLDATLQQDFFDSQFARSLSFSTGAMTIALGYRFENSIVVEGGYFKSLFHDAFDELADPLNAYDSKEIDLDARYITIGYQWNSANDRLFVRPRAGVISRNLHIDITLIDSLTGNRTSYDNLNDRSQNLIAGLEAGIKFGQVYMLSLNYSIIDTDNGDMTMYGIGHSIRF